MSTERNVDGDPLAEALRSMRPATPEIDRDALMFRAGKAAGARQRQRTTIIASIAGVVCGAVLLGAPAWLIDHGTESIVVVEKTRREKPLPKVDAPAPPKDDSPQVVPPPPILVMHQDGNDGVGPLDVGGYVALRNHMLRWGPDATPSSRAVTETVDEPQRARTVLGMYEDFVD